MAKSRRFRPAVGEVLEDRAVPSLFGFFGGLSSSVSAQDAQLVRQDFRTFEQSYGQAVSTLVQTSTSATTLATNFSSFNTSTSSTISIGTNTTVNTLSGLLKTLNTSIDAHINNLSTASSLSTTIQGELIGSGSNSLQSLLTGITPPTSTGSRAFRSIASAADGDIRVIQGQVVQQVRSAPTPTGTISRQTLQQALSSVNVAYQGFNQTYFGLINTDLLPSGTTTPSATQVAKFDSDVGNALTTLNNSVDTAVSGLGLPGASLTKLETILSNDLLTGSSTSGNSLQSRLAGLPAPNSSQFLSTSFFKVRSQLDIAASKAQVYQDIASAVAQYNSSLSG